MHKDLIGIVIFDMCISIVGENAYFARPFSYQYSPIHESIILRCSVLEKPL